MDAVAAELSRLGFQMRQDWLQQCWSHLIRECGGSLERISRDEQFALVYEQALFSNFHAAASGKLPAGVGGTHDTWIRGPIVLQIDELVNISDSAEHRIDATQSTRMLKLSLTDGKQQVFGIEFRPLPELGVDTPAGTKVAIASACVLRGLLLLVPENVRVLGGQVEALRAHQVRMLQQQTREARGPSPPPPLPSEAGPDHCGILPHAAHSPHSCTARQRAAGLDPDQPSITADGTEGGAVGDTPQPPSHTGHAIGEPTPAAAPRAAGAAPTSGVQALSSPQPACVQQPAASTGPAAGGTPQGVVLGGPRGGGGAAASARARAPHPAPAASPPPGPAGAGHPVTPTAGAARGRAGAGASVLSLVVPAGARGAGGSSQPAPSLAATFVTRLGGRGIVGMGVPPDGADAAECPVVPLSAAAAIGRGRTVWCKCCVLAYTQFNLKQVRVHVQLSDGSCSHVAALAVGVCEQMLGMPVDQMKETGKRFKQLSDLEKTRELYPSEKQARDAIYKSITGAARHLEQKQALFLIGLVSDAEERGVALVTPRKSKINGSAQSASQRPTLVVHMVAAANAGGS